MKLYQGKNYGEERNGNVLWNRGIRGVIPGLGGGASDSEETSRPGNRKRNQGLAGKSGFLNLACRPHSGKAGTLQPVRGVNPPQNL